MNTQSWENNEVSAFMCLKARREREGGIRVWGSRSYGEWLSLWEDQDLTALWKHVWVEVFLLSSISINEIPRARNQLLFFFY